MKHFLIKYLYIKSNYRGLKVYIHMHIGVLFYAYELKKINKALCRVTAHTLMAIKKIILCVWVWATLFLSSSHNHCKCYINKYFIITLQCNPSNAKSRSVTVHVLNGK